MNEKDLNLIEKRIGYTFCNKDLLQQAFVRRSFAEENGGEDNEVLEFIGDKVLDVIVVKMLSDKFGYYMSECDGFNSQKDFDEFACEFNEGELTEIKKRLVRKETLAKQIDILGLSEFLIMGKGDIKKCADKQASVKEDLFEAIIGAVALDSNYNMRKLEDVIREMLNPDLYICPDKDNYVELIQEYCLNEYNEIPEFEYTPNKRPIVPFGIDGIDYGNIDWICSFYIGDIHKEFRGQAQSKSKARMLACKKAYEYLEDNDLIFTIRDEIENPNLDDAIGQLETLARRGYFSIPTYEFNQEYDNNGNPIWTCECYIEEKEYYCNATSSSKKSAKKKAAFEMLNSILEES